MCPRATPSVRKDGGHHPQPPGRHHEHHQDFPDKVGVSHAKKLPAGDVFVPIYKSDSGPHSVRKAIQQLLQRLPGFRVLWNNVSEVGARR